MVSILTIGLLTVAGCATGRPAGSPPTAPAGQPEPAVTAPASQQPAEHIFVIVMENKDPREIAKAPYLSSLQAQYAVATNYHAVAHPSLPNYLALTSGSTWHVGDDHYRALPKQDLGTQLTGANISWRAYMEGIGPDCLSDYGDYAVKHNPFAFYGGACPPNVASFDQFAAD